MMRNILKFVEGTYGINSIEVNFGIASVKLVAKVTVDLSAKAKIVVDGNFQIKLFDTEV
jgi:hypothetical protein